MNLEYSKFDIAGHYKRLYKNSIYLPLSDNSS